MSKSLNNFFTVRDVAKEFDYDVIRFFMLRALITEIPSISVTNCFARHVRD